MQADELIHRWYRKAQLDYSQLYLQLYISYNAWYRKVTHSDFDREAIARLKRRTRIWVEYTSGQTMQSLRPIVQHISSRTRQVAVVGLKNKWSGIVVNEYDYENLIEFWYQIRCSVFHGNAHQDERFGEFVKLAYLSLNIFMGEIISRMNECITAKELVLLGELEQLNPDHQNPELDKIRYLLRQKFVEWPDVWNVDT